MRELLLRLGGCELDLGIRGDCGAGVLGCGGIGLGCCFESLLKFSRRNCLL